MKRIIFILVTFLMFLSSQAEAALSLTNAEFYTYGGFHSISQSFQRIALIFSDNGYKGLFATVVILAIIFGSIAVYIRILSGARVGALSWAPPVLLGVVVYLTLIVPKGSVTVYDPVLNRFQTINNIPVGITATVGVLNFIERNLVDIIKTAGDPASYEISAGGTGVDILFKVLRSGLVSADSDFDRTMNEYIDKCFYFEMGRPGNAISINDLRQNNLDFTAFFAQASSPAVFTVYYPPTEGVTKQCDEAWALINQWLQQPANIQPMIRETCASAGVDPNNAGEMNQCTSLIEGHLQKLWGVNVSATQFVRQIYLAKRLEDVAKKNGVIETSGYYTGVSGTSTGAVLNQWIPVVKAVVTSVAIAMIPFLLIFVPTPLGGKAFAVIVGFLVWLTTWGVIDAVVHQYIIDYGVTVFEELRNKKLGYDAIMFMPDPFTKVLGMFGYIRSSGMMLATIVTGMLIRFGSHAMAMFASQISGSVSSQAQSAGTKVDTPSGQASTIQSMALAAGTLAWANEHSFYSRMRAEKAQKSWGTADGLAKGNVLTDQGFDSLTDSMGWNYGSSVSMAGKERQLYGSPDKKAEWDIAGRRAELSGYGNPGRKTDVMLFDIEKKVGGTETEKNITKRYFDGDTVRYGAFAVSGYQVDEELAGKLQADGFWGIKAGMKLDKLSASFDKDSGKLMSGTFTRQDGQAKEAFTDGKLERHFISSDGFDTTQIISKDGMMINQVGRKVLDRDMEITDRKGNIFKVQSGAEISKVGDRDGAVFTYKGIINGREGHIVTDGEGNVARIEAKGGVNLSYDEKSTKYLVIADQERLEEMALTADGLGKVNMARGIRESIKKGEAVAFAAEMTPDGHIATIKAGTGGRFSREDFRNDLKGWESVTKALDAVDKGRRIQVRDIDNYQDERSYGVKYSFGDDLEKAIVHNDMDNFTRTYRHFFAGHTPSDGGVSLIRNMADRVGGYGKISQSIHDAFAASAHEGVDFSKTAWGKVVTNIVGLQIGGSLEQQRRAVESIDVNTVAIGMQKRYGEIMKSGMLTERKAAQTVHEFHQIYDLIEQNTTKSTKDQMFDGADNPAKGQGISKDRGATGEW